MPATLPAFGINLVASLSVDIGLGASARALAHALQRHGVPHVIADVKHPERGEVPVEGLDAPRAKGPEDLCHPISLYAVSIAALEELVRSHPALVARRRLHVASLYWEASALPPAWAASIGRLDAVLAGSGFLAHVMANGLAHTPVIEAPLPLVLPEGVAADRARFGLPAGATVFLLSFDPNSDPARKNPFGAVQAFRTAFPAAVRDVHMVVRMNHADSPMGRETLEHLAKVIGGDARVRLMIEPMDYAGVLSLYASADAYVSLHRGEGLGLGLLESMALGKPVIATAWSGNMSFMDPRCGCLVRYQPAVVKANLPFFKQPFLGEQARWAEPLLEDAVHWMRALHVDGELRLRLGRAAMAAARDHQERAWSRRWIDELEALWRAQALLPALAGKYSSLGAA